MRAYSSSKFFKKGWAVAPLLIISCSSTALDVNLGGERGTNALSQRVNERVCITEVINNDDLGMYILLAPFEDEEGVIQPSPPRIQIFPTRSDNPLQELTNGRSYRVCGILRDSTPSQTCDRDECKWYELREAHLG